MRTNGLHPMKKDVRKHPLRPVRTIAQRLLDTPKPPARVGQKK